MTQRKFNPHDYLTSEYIDKFREYTNTFYPPEVYTAPHRGEKGTADSEISRYIMFVGITEEHLTECLAYFKESIFPHFTWLTEEMLTSLYEIFLNIQSSTLNRSCEMLARGQGRISSDNFMVKVEVCERFFHMDVIEHGERFDYVTYDKKRNVLQKKLEEDTRLLPDFHRLSDVPHKLIITKEGGLKTRESHGLGMSFIEETSEGDYYIAEMKFKETDDFCKVIRFRIENRGH